MPMMEAGWQTVAPLTVAPYTEIRTGANNPIWIYEIGIWDNAATAASIGLYRPTAIGVTPATTTIPVPEDPDVATASTVVIANTWGTAPTIGAGVAIRRTQLSANIGAGVIWSWPVQPLKVSKNSSLVIWNPGGATGPVLNMYITFME